VPSAIHTSSVPQTFGVGKPWCGSVSPPAYPAAVVTDPSRAHDADTLTALIARIVGVLRTTPRYRLRAPCTGRFESRVDAGRALAAALATATQGIEEAGVAAVPAWRTLPVLPDLAVGDQVAVTAADYLRALSEAPATVWTPSGRAAIASVEREVGELIDEVGALY
jgi:hypothetical protein